MGSFFYGNNFGKNSMLFPFIASKANTNILFEDSKFSTERAAKASTARVVLGNLIRETGNVYTYEVSFYGNYKQVIICWWRINQMPFLSMRITINNSEKLSFYLCIERIWRCTKKKNLLSKAFSSKTWRRKFKSIPLQKTKRMIANRGLTAKHKRPWIDKKRN